MFQISYFELLKNFIIFVCVILSSTLFYDVINKNISGESYQALSSEEHETLIPPIFTLCPGTGFKNSGLLKNEYLVQYKYANVF